MKKTGFFIPLLLVISLLSLAPFLSAHQEPSYDVRRCKQACLQLRHDEAVRRLCEQKCEQLRDQSGEGKENPYVFGHESFEHIVRSEHGSLKVLKKFSSLSPLLHGVENYRLALLETEPLTFAMPAHIDADSICYVVDGEGVVSVLHEGNRESHSLEKGDIIRAWAGSIIYVINKSRTKKLRIAKLMLPVGNPGKVKAFYSAGSGAAESFYQSFSTELLEAALNIKRDQLESFLGKHNREVIIKAPEEKIRAIAQRSSKSEGGPWPFTRSKKPFNLLRKRPSHENNRGQLFEADSNDYEQLRDVNARVSYANISRGSMIVPFYLTRAFKLAVVEKGSGYIEIICPHASTTSRDDDWKEEEKEERRKQRHGGAEQQQVESIKYTRVSSPLTAGSVFVIPPGHPTAIIAGREQDLRIVCYEIPAENNEVVYFAGKNNILNEMENEAKELAFGVPAKVVDEVLRAQKAEVFVAGPEERKEGKGREEGRRPLEYSILEAAAGF